MSSLKTQPTDSDVKSFIDQVDDPVKKGDSFRILEIMQQITNEQPQMWGTSIIGFGSYHYKYDSGREGDWFLTGFSPRKQNLTLYIMPGLEQFQDLLTKLGKHKTGKGCLYIKKISDIDETVLSELIKKGVARLKEKYPS